MTLDLKKPQGMDVLYRLLEAADVLVSNLAPGAASRLGLSSEQLAARFPDLITVEIDGYGPGGPLSEKRAYDLLVQAESGTCAVTGHEGAPAKPGPAVADVTTGLYAALSVMGLLYGRERRRTPGRGGAAVSVSLFDTMMEMLGYQLNFTRHTGVDQQPLGMSSPAVAPYGAYPTADGHTVVMGTTHDLEWQRLARKVIERPDLADDAAVCHQLRACGASRRTRRGDRRLVWATRLGPYPEDRGRGGHRQRPVQPISEVIAHPHLQARDRWRVDRNTRRVRYRRCCHRRSLTASLRQWARCPRWVSTPRPYSPNWASAVTRSPGCAHWARSVLPTGESDVKVLVTDSPDDEIGPARLALPIHPR